MSRVTAKLEVAGPLHDGLGAHEIRQVLTDTVQELTDEGTRELKSWVMDKSGRATGFFQNHIVTTTMKKYGMAEVIHAEYPAVLYGPWLEGVSERNRSTRFKGYHLFRLTSQKLNDEATRIVERKLNELIARHGL